MLSGPKLELLVRAALELLQLPAQVLAVLVVVRVSLAKRRAGKITYTRPLLRVRLSC